MLLPEVAPQLSNSTQQQVHRTNEDPRNCCKAARRDADMFVIMWNGRLEVRLLKFLDGNLEICPPDLFVHSLLLVLCCRLQED